MATFYMFLKASIWTLFRYGIAYAACFYWGNFTQAQSIILALMGVCAWDGNKIAFKLQSKKYREFVPFWISIKPNWYSICNDFGLAAGEKWTDLQEKCKAAPTEYSILRNGLNFTMVGRSLFYSNDHNSFFGELDFQIPLEELNQDPNKYHLFTPQFYVKRKVVVAKKKVVVIEFGLVTPESVKKSVHPRDDRRNIPLASLPEIMLYPFTNPDEYNYESLNIMKLIDKDTDAQLKQFDWSKGERDPEDSWLDRPFEINHKYIQVRYRGL
jgi:hypothetical protein